MAAEIEKMSFDQKRGGGGVRLGEGGVRVDVNGEVTLF